MIITVLVLTNSIYGSNFGITSMVTVIHLTEAQTSTMKERK